MSTTRTTARLRALVAAAVAALLTAVGVVGAVSAQAVETCRVDWTTNAWPGGFVTEARLTTGPARSGWTLTFDLAAGEQIGHAWSATATQSGASVTVTNAPWNGQLAAGATVAFGFQGTTTGTPLPPRDVRLDGVACEGQTGPTATPTPTSTQPTDPPSPTPTVTPTPTPTPTGQPNPTDPPSPTPTATPTPTPSPTPTATPTVSPTPTPTSPPGGCGGSFCDGFETQTSAAPTAPWSVVHPDCSGTGTASIDSSVARSGTRSLRVDGAVGYCNHVFVQADGAVAAAAGQPVYVRFWVRHTTALPTSHVTFAAFEDANDGDRDLRLGGQNGALQWNRSSDDATLPEQSPSGVALSRPLPTGEWACVEALVEPAGRLTTWLNGTEVAGLVADGTPTHDVDGQWHAKAWTPRLVDLRLGWESYGDGADTLWYDDVAVGTSRTGC